jgi:glycosyltransferase involved in cell wall biosynthesis
LIHTFHTEPVENEKLFLLGKVFFQHLLNECDYVTFASKRLKQKIMDIWGLRFRNTEITYAGVHIPQKIPDYEIKKFREEFRIKENSIVLLAIGLTALKYKAEGAKLLIKAVKKLKSKYPNILLLITREESFSNELKEFALFEGVSENIIFTGDIDDPNVPLQICDIYTHTPLGEGGVSLAVLEAMAIGKPIIATSVGGIPEIIEDGINGLIVQPEVDQIAQKIDYLLENKDLAAKLGENAQNKVKSKFIGESQLINF